MTVFVSIFQQWAFLRLRMTCAIKRYTHKLGRDILGYVSKFPQKPNPIAKRTISIVHMQRVPVTQDNTQ